MKCEIIRLLERGIRKSKTQPPVAGELVLYRWDDGSNRDFRIRAELRGPDGRCVIPLVDHAMVTKITEGGIVIIGTELVTYSASIKTRMDRFPQTWWCKVNPTTQKSPLSRV